MADRFDMPDRMRHPRRGGLLRVQRQALDDDHITTVYYRPLAAAYTVQLWIFNSPDVFPDNPAAVQAFQDELRRAQEWAAGREYLDNLLLTTGIRALKGLARHLCLHPSRFNIGGPEPIDKPETNRVSISGTDKKPA